MLDTTRILSVYLAIQIVCVWFLLKSVISFEILFPTMRFHNRTSRKWHPNHKHLITLYGKATQKLIIRQRFV